MDEVAKNHNVSLSAVALAWLRAQPTVSVPIASARTVEQVREIMEIINLTSTEISKLTTFSTFSDNLLK
jgi:aryl-alcohol dehydrogenase-like predicted oxidoreductase